MKHFSAQTWEHKSCPFPDLVKLGQKPNAFMVSFAKALGSRLEATETTLVKEMQAKLEEMTQRLSTVVNMRADDQSRATMDGQSEIMIQL